jgi:hypothetical protein|nr:MAG TPA: nucelotide kinase [Caudoviricetes sp.]
MKKRLCDSCIHSECSKSDNPISTIVSCGVTVDCLDYKSVDSAKEVNCEECIYYNMGDGCEYSYCKKEYDDYYYKEKEKNAIKPSHYKAGEFDVIAFCQLHNINFDLGNVIKYVTRAGKKENNSELQDLNKAMEYLKRRIEFIKGE